MGRGQARWSGRHWPQEWWQRQLIQGRSAEQAGTTANEHLHQMSAEPQTRPQLLRKHAFTPLPTVVLQHVCSRQAERSTQCTTASFTATHGAHTSGSPHLAILLQCGGSLAAWQPLDVFQAFAEPEMKQAVQNGDGSLRREPQRQPLAVFQAFAEPARLGDSVGELALQAYGRSVG